MRALAPGRWSPRSARARAGAWLRVGIGRAGAACPGGARWIWSRSIRRVGRV